LQLNFFVFLRFELLLSNKNDLKNFFALPLIEKGGGGEGEKKNLQSFGFDKKLSAASFVFSGWLAKFVSG
jgi:hypothetical protein